MHGLGKASGLLTWKPLKNWLYWSERGTGRKEYEGSGVLWHPNDNEVVSFDTTRNRRSFLVTQMWRQIALSSQNRPKETSHFLPTVTAAFWTFNLSCFLHSFFLFQLRSRRQVYLLPHCFFVLRALVTKPSDRTAMVFLLSILHEKTNAWIDHFLPGWTLESALAFIFVGWSVKVLRRMMRRRGMIGPNAPWRRGRAKVIGIPDRYKRNWSGNDQWWWWCVITEICEPA